MATRPEMNGRVASSRCRSSRLPEARALVDLTRLVQAMKYLSFC